MGRRYVTGAAGRVLLLQVWMNVTAFLLATAAWPPIKSSNRLAGELIEEEIDALRLSEAT
jgi:hypothetical protein